jgi:ATP nucleosidase Cap17-like protein
MAGVPRRVHIAGSSSKSAEPVKLRYAHELVRTFTRRHLLAGGSVVAQVGDEPVSESDPSLAVTWDWTVIDEVSTLVTGDKVEPRGATGGVLAIAGSQKGLDKIPDSRRDQWNGLLSAGAVKLEVLPPDWRSGALIRERQVHQGDVLVTLSGGMGVEHLADLYSARSKHIIPLDLALGSSYDDSKRGGEWLAREALGHPDRFFVLGEHPDQAVARLQSLTTRDGKAPIGSVIDNLLALLDALRDPQVMCVRLLNEAAPEHADVERYFRESVDPLIKEFGYVRHEVGTDEAKAGFMNAEIFEQLDRSAIVFADLTAMRPNCFGEMCFAFGRDLKTIVSVREDQVGLLPFDFKAIPCFTWTPTKTDAQTTEKLRDFWIRHIDRPPLVTRRALV